MQVASGVCFFIRGYGKIKKTSLIPGLDTFTNIASIPVDLMRGDYISAGLDLVGVIPFVGEIADVAKTARTADRIIDGVRVADKTIDVVKTADKAVDALEAVDDANDAVRVMDDAVDVVKVIEELPVNPSDLTKTGWKDITLPVTKQNSNSRTYTKGGITIRYDKAKMGEGGYRGKDHYHILNPNSTGKHDYYLDRYGRPIPKNSKASHIIKEE